MQVSKNGITIIYEENQIKEVKRCLDFLRRNTFLTNNLNIKSNIHIYVEDFYDLVDVMISDVIKYSEIDKMIDDKDFLKILHLSLLLNDFPPDTEPLFKLDMFYTPDTINFLLATKYYNLDVKKIIEHLDKKKNSTKLFAWLKNTSRYDTYNYLLDFSANCLEKSDSVFYDNFEYFLTVMQEESENYQKLKYYYGESRENLKLEKLSGEEFNSLFNNYLTYIKVPDEWRDNYEMLKEEKRIVFKYNEGVETGAYYKRDKNSKGIIYVESDCTTKMFLTFVHEFIHYITLRKNEPLTHMKDFPSIYYEDIAAEFLVANGYSDDIIKDIIIRRNNGNLFVYNKYLPLLLDINKYKNNGPLSREDIDKKACDNKIEKLFSTSQGNLSKYNYLTGTMLANQVLASNRTDKKEKMIDITENLDSYNAIDIMNYFNTEKKLIKK